MSFRSVTGAFQISIWLGARRQSATPPRDVTYGMVSCHVSANVVPVRHRRIPDFDLVGLVAAERDAAACPLELDH